MYKNQKVLVAGGTGTIGIPLVHLLLQAGAEVHVTSLESPEFAKKTLGVDVRFEKMDLTSQENCLKATKGMDYVFNLLGIKGSVGIGQKKVASYFVPMIRFQTNLMDAAFQNKVKRFLFVGSVNEYPQQLTPKKEDSVWSGSPTQNDRIPGLAKRIGEVQAEAYYLEHGWDGVRIVRPANVYGPYDDFNPETAQVIPALIARIVRGENPLKVWGDGSAVRDFIYSEDAARGMMLALEKAPVIQPINLSTGEGVSIREVVETLLSVSPQKPPVIWDEKKPAGDPVRILSIERARTFLNFKPETTLKEGLKKTFEWYLSEGNYAKKLTAKV